MQIMHTGCNALCITKKEKRKNAKSLNTIDKWCLWISLKDVIYTIDCK
jgi:hypothetical protein